VAWTGWDELLALLTSIGFGVVSAVVPVANAEAYIVASQMTALAGAVPIAVGVAIGQTVGKLLLFLGVRRGREFAVFRRRQHKAQARFTGPTAVRVRALLARLLDLVGQKRWGLPIVLLAAVVGIPPLYAVALLAGATRMPALGFALTVLVGRLARFVLVATGSVSLSHWLF
jgi:membrane protein YqaA with SNARE-associated domain